MIYIKATRAYFNTQFYLLLRRMEIEEKIANFNPLRVKEDIGRLIFLAGETLEENDFIDMMVYLIKTYPSFNPKDFKKVFIQSVAKNYNIPQ